MADSALATVEVNGARLRYLDRGQGPVLLLVHGLGASHADWQPQWEVLADTFRLIAPDLRGHGGSTRSGPFSVERFASDLLQLLEALNINRLNIAGHSMGGAVAMQMALLRPQWVQKLVLANTVPDFRPVTLAQRWMLWSRVLMMRWRGPQALAARSARLMFPLPAQQAVREAIAQRNAANDPAVYIETTRALARWSVADKLDWLTMPTLVLASEHDFFPASMLQSFAERLPDGYFRIFEGAHHHLPLELPDDLSRVVQEFLLPGSKQVERGPRENTLNWLRIDPDAAPPIDLDALLTPKTSKKP
jgi:3-oxoadipate enol-lactonase